MDLDLTEDQAALLKSVTAILARADQELDGEKTSFAAALDAELAENGVFDAAAHEELGLPTAVLVVHEISRSPAIVEAAASAILRPLLCPDAPRPLAIVHGPVVRFLPVARAVLSADGWSAVEPSDVETVESYFAYPMGRLRAPKAAVNATRLTRIAIAAELSGVLQGALDAVIAYVRERRQFGKTIASFQAVQHRLAECATRITAAKWLAVKAAAGTDADAMLAAGYAQETVDKVTYDLHQFMGAMGLTLEHPLYRWTYRAKLLKSELGGASQSFRALADATWPT